MMKVNHRQAKVALYGVERLRTHYVEVHRVVQTCAGNLGKMSTAADHFNSSLQELRAFLSRVEPSSTVLIPEQLMPVFRSVIQFYRRERATQIEGWRASVVSRELVSALEEEIKPFDELIVQPSYSQATPLPVPQPTDFVTMERASDLQAINTVPPPVKYEDKFNILLASSAIAPFLAYERKQCELRRVPLSVVFLDIDDFKRLNTRYGEPRVDRDLLPDFMRLIERTAFGRGHAFRDGGDECVLLFPNADVEYACFVLGRLNAGLAEVRFHEIDEVLTVTCGVCTVYPDSFLTDRESRDRAAKAKKRAKEYGKNCIGAYNGDQFRDGDIAIFKPDGTPDASRPSKLGAAEVA